jgi:hypothetical protein
LADHGASTVSLSEDRLNVVLGSRLPPDGTLTHLAIPTDGTFTSTFLMATQQQLALQMVAQLRVLDPSISAEVGTPERKIIDTVAQALAESQIDLDVLSGSLDLTRSSPPT